MQGEGGGAKSLIWQVNLEDGRPPPGGGGRYPLTILGNFLVIFTEELIPLCLPYNPRNFFNNLL